jgi:hypothetical protein
MPHKTRFEKFERYFERYHIEDRLTVDKSDEKKTPGGAVHAVKSRVERFPTTPDCIDFFNPDNKSLWLPGVTDTAKYIHGLNESETIKAAREHALTCRKCAITLDAFLLSQAQPDLFHGAMRDIITFEIHQDKLKNIYIATLPWPGHEASTQTGRLVYVTRLPIQNGVWEFEGRVIERLRSRGLDIQVSDFAYTTKQDGEEKGSRKRTPCYQATAHLPEKSGYICIRSKANSKPVETTE